MSDAVAGSGERRDLFDALAEPLRNQITAGVLAPGAFLLSEAGLARAAGTTRHSIRRALFRLQERGMIEPVAGRGWVVLGAMEVGQADYTLPRYRQIAAEIQAAIETGRLRPGTALPSESELITRHRVSRGTVRQALTFLESRDLINTCAGKGRYVS
ncbi:MAG: GntR family transcriptional regulator [Dehalococcoidia bacterium]